MAANQKTTNKDAVREHICSEIETENVTNYSLSGDLLPASLCVIVVYLSRLLWITLDQTYGAEIILTSPKKRWVE